MKQFIITKSPMQAHIGGQKEIKTTHMDEAKECFVYLCDQSNICYSYPILKAFFHQECNAEYSVGGVGHDYRITIEAVIK